MTRSRAHLGSAGTDPVEITNGILRLRMAPEFGARITELIDLRSGRNWIVPGDLAGSASNAADYLDARPNGWDECFPTVAPCEVGAWGGALRDHGALWGRPWSCQTMPSGVTATYNDPRFLFRRAIRLAGEHVLLRYTLTGRHAAPLPWLWTQHCLLACQPGERIMASGIGAWRDAGGAEVEAGPVLPPEAGVAGKHFAPVTSVARVALSGAQGSIESSWRKVDAPWVGLWFSYGGWSLEDPLPDRNRAGLAFGRLSDAVEAG